ncbi:DUF1062 domain-containing protein [Prevotella sp. 10(H)]|uniref:DUF1062 domain-containing protein n=1 Tax=Prevotella sp. 10(H) TaxID=1158294 RepID=UPI0004A6F833|nr:DUF1062 domain-containing protein [Prevotella sp. 10(H)]
MGTTKHFVWTVIPAGTPLYKKKCTKCKSSDYYYSSDRFRMNSQKRTIDVWLIYKCQICDNTCNITILSRTKPELIDRELYRKFSMNDEETAWKYAFDMDIIRKNKMEADYDNIEFDIVGDNISLEDIANMEENFIEFEIRAAYHLNIKLLSVIRKGLNISSGRLKKMLEAGSIKVPMDNIKKYKIGKGTSFTICRKNLTSL